jgi:hypothetical protein
MNTAAQTAQTGSDIAAGVAGGMSPELAAQQQQQQHQEQQLVLFNQEKIYLCKEVVVFQGVQVVHLHLIKVLNH